MTKEQRIKALEAELARLKSLKSDEEEEVTYYNPAFKKLLYALNECTVENPVKLAGDAINETIVDVVKYTVALEDYFFADKEGRKKARQKVMRMVCA